MLRNPTERSECKERTPLPADCPLVLVVSRRLNSAHAALESYRALHYAAPALYGPAPLRSLEAEFGALRGELFRLMHPDA